MTVINYLIDLGLPPEEILQNIGKPDEDYGVRDFKVKFGDQLVNCGRNTCVHAPTLLRFSSFGHQLYRRFL